MNEWLDKIFFSNTIREYLISLLAAFVLLVFIRIFRTLALKRMKTWSAKTANLLDDFIVQQTGRLLVPFLYGAAVYLSLHYLKWPAGIHQALRASFIIFSTILVIRFLIAVLHALSDFYWNRNRPEEEKESIKGISGLISLVVWSMGLLFMLDNLGFRISTIVAGLGIGGIAVALAAQTILGDLFSYIVIFLDRPFQIGDFIVVDDKIGAVEYIGIKTTRIRSLSGEQLVFSNKDLTDSRIHNFKKMEQRRVVFSLGVTYQTSSTLLRAIPDIIRSIVEAHDNVRFDRAHFKAYGDFSLNFEIVYFVLGADYNQYMDIQQSINLRVFDEFALRGIEFAYPTQTVFVEKNAALS